MVAKGSVVLIVSCITALIFLGTTPARAGNGAANGAPTGQIVRLQPAQGSYIDANGKSRPILNFWLRNSDASDSTLIYALDPGKPQVGSEYEMSVPDGVRSFIFWPAYWLVHQHQAVGQPLDNYFQEQEAVQLCIWGYYNETFLSPDRVPDRVVLERAQELCSAGREAMTKPIPHYQLVHRRVGLTLFVRGSTATKVLIEARLFDLDNDKGLVGQKVDLSYDGRATSVKAGNGGVVVQEYKRSDSKVEVDVHAGWTYPVGIPWVSTDGKGIPVITAEPFSVSLNRQELIDPSTLTSGATLAYQEGSDFIRHYTPFKSAPAAEIGLFVLAATWVLMLGRTVWRWSTSRDSRPRNDEEIGQQ